MTKIEPDIDRYGKVARASCLADYVELLTLCGYVCTKAQLEDAVGDRWGMKRQILLLPGEGTDTEEESEQYADAAWTCFSERSETLGDLYPFTVEESRLVLKRDFDRRDSPYVGMLCITLAHAYKVPSAHNVEHLFEDIVVDTMRALGLAAEGFGGHTRASGYDFVEGLRRMGLAMSIPVDADAASRHVSANDSGLDVLGHLDWSDGRFGRWLFLGQVTCGMSDRWPEKLTEVKVNRWRKFLTEMIDPVVFLAVPHHVDSRAYFDLLEGDEKAVVDRSRIVRQLRSNRHEVRDIIDAVLAAEIETLQV